MSSVAVDAGLNISGVGAAEIRQDFQKLLADDAVAGKNCVIVVDEAQNLSNDVLEKLRLLSNFESGTRKFVQVILAGQPQLAAKLAHPELTQLRQRLAIVASLEPLSAQEVHKYIDHRVSVAGYTGTQLFTDEALSLVVSDSEGIPRKINILCYNALALGCVQKRKRVDLGIVEQAVTDLAFRRNDDRLSAKACLSGKVQVAHSQNKSTEDIKDPTVGNATRRPTVGLSRTWDQSCLGSPTKRVLGTVALVLIVFATGFRPRPSLWHASHWAQVRSVETSTSALKLSALRLAGVLTPTAVSPYSNQAAIVTDIRYFPGRMAAKVVISLDGPLQYAVHRIAGPDRVYVDLNGARLSSLLFGRQFTINTGLLRKLRIAEHAGSTTRVTLETYERCDYSIAVTPNPNRLTIEVWSPLRLTRTSARNQTTVGR